MQENYAQYIAYKQTVNAKEAVAGFLWAAAIIERPALERARQSGRREPEEPVNQQ